MGSIYTMPGIAGRAVRYARSRVRNVLGWGARLAARRRLKRPRPGRRHGLAGELIVSLTSYPARYDTLHLTLGCLLDQSLKADRTILWVAHDDIDELPPQVRELKRHGLEIRPCEDLRSFKKLIPAIHAFPDAFIVTADDDLYFPANWLETLVDGVEPGKPAVVCHRAHRRRQSADGRLAPYLEWEFDVQDERARQPSVDIMPTSGAGALYPPHSLHPQVRNRALFQRLCPDGDDLWFYWCARMAGTPIRKVGGRMMLITWAGSQDQSLWTDNRQGGNDRMIKALIDEYGVETLEL